MTFTETQLEILSNAYALALKGKGQVIHDELVPEAHALAEGGWLTRRFEPNDDLSWWWSPSANQAVALHALKRQAEANVN